MSRQAIEIEISDDESNQLLRAFPEGLVAFDLETTGLSPANDKIIEIAAVKINADGKLETFHELVNPMITIPEKTIQYHQITDDIIKDKPSLKNPLKDFLDFTGNLPLVAHNAQFDVGFMVVGMHQYKYHFSLSDVFDSCRLTRSIYRKNKEEEKPADFKLSTIADYFNVSFTHHQALDDALVCLRIFAHSIMKLNQVSLLDQIREKSFLFKISSFKNLKNLELPKKFDPILNAIRNEEFIQISYQGGSHSDLRPIRPIGFIPMPTGLVLLAECQIDHMNKNFSIKKIKKIEPFES